MVTSHHSIRSKIPSVLFSRPKKRHQSLLRQFQSQGSDEFLTDSKIEARAFVELVNHVEYSLKSGTFRFIFSALCQMYKNHLGDLGINKEINKVRFK